MIGVVLLGVLFDRPALTMRTLTIAALVVLLFAPESIVHPSFQMSFAATLALIAGYERGAIKLRGRADTSLGARAALSGANEIVGLTLLPCSPAWPRRHTRPSTSTVSRPMASLPNRMDECGGLVGCEPARRLCPCAPVRRWPNVAGADAAQIVAATAATPPLQRSGVFNRPISRKPAVAAASGRADRR